MKIKIKKLRRYAVTYIPSKDAFAVNLLRKGMVVQKRYRKNTSIIRATTPNKALRKLSAKSYKLETGRRL